MSERRYPEPDRSGFGRTRDLIAYHVSTWVLNHIATPWYRAMIGGAIRLGLDAARKEARAEKTVPTKDLIPEKGRQTND